jgi:hypothetical protein
LLPFGDAFSAHDKSAVFTAVRADVCEAQKLESLRLALAPFCPVFLGKTSELDKARLLRVQFQPECTDALLKSMEKFLCILSVLKSHHEVIGVPHDVNLASGMSFPPCRHP